MKDFKVSNAVSFSFFTFFETIVPDGSQHPSGNCLNGIFQFATIGKIQASNPKTKMLHSNSKLHSIYVSSLMSSCCFSNSGTTFILLIIYLIYLHKVKHHAKTEVCNNELALLYVFSVLNGNQQGFTTHSFFHLQ